MIEASGGREALTNALVDPPSLIVSELRLPFIDACALCDILRRDAATHAVPILVLTRDARPTEVAYIRHLGADAVLVEPTTPETLVSEAERLMARARHRRPDATTTTMPARPAAQCDEGDEVTTSTTRRTALSKAHQRFTTTAPSIAPPALMCPSCARWLKYEQSHVGGVSDRHAEQWDDYTCSTCGSFEFRQRTRKLRRLS